MTDIPDPMAERILQMATHPAPPVAYQRARLAVDLYEAWYGSTGSWPAPTDLPDLTWPDDAAVGVAIDAIMTIRRRDVAAGHPACVICGCTPNAACHGGCAWLPADLFDGPTCTSCGKECVPIECSDSVEMEASAIYEVEGSADVAMLDAAGVPITVGCTVNLIAVDGDPPPKRYRKGIVQALDLDGTVDVAWPYIGDDGRRCLPASLIVTAHP